MPTGAPTSSKLTSAPPSITYLTPVSCFEGFDIISHLAIDEMLERASPLNPRVCMLNRSLALLILLVACLKKAVLISSLLMPPPLSVTLIKLVPPSFISMLMAKAPESIAFSTSSLTIEEGLSTTSPAAILSIVFLSSTDIIILSLYPVLYLVLQLIKYIQSIYGGKQT